MIIKKDLAIAIIKKNPEIINKITNSQKLSAFIKAIGITNEYIKRELAIAIIKKNPKIINKITNSQKLSTFIKEFDFKDDHNKKDLAIAIIKQKPEMIENSTELSTFIKAIGIKGEYSKTELAVAIIGKNHDSIKDIDDSSKLLEFIVNELQITNDYGKTKLAIAIIGKKPEIISDLKSSQELLAFIVNQLKITRDDHKKDLAIAIINQNPDSIKDIDDSSKLNELLNSIVNELKITRVNYKAELAIKIIEKKPEIISDLKSSQELLAFIKAIGFTDDCDKRSLAIAIIKQKPEILGSNKEEKVKGLSELIKAIGYHHRVDLICNLLKELTQTVVIDFKALNENLYQDDYFKRDLILKAIDKGVINQSNFLYCGFDKIKTEDIYLDILTKAKVKGIVTNKDLFNNLQLPQHYNSLRWVLKDIKVEGIIEKEAIINIAKFIYEDDPVAGDINELKAKDALSLISFYDFFNNNAIITSSLKENVAEQLKSSFQPMGFKTLDDKDISNIASLIGKNVESLGSKYLNLNEIAGIFLPFLKKIPDSSKSIEGIKDEEIKKVSSPLNVNYKALLELIAPEAKALIEPKDNLVKLNNLIADNKNNFFYILANDKSDETINNIILGVAEGCPANIANQINNRALLLAIENLPDISEERKYSLLAIYNVFMEKAIIPLINKGGDQLGASSSANFLVDNLNKPLLTGSFLPLTALHKWLELSPGEVSKIIGEDKENLFIDYESPIIQYRGSLTAFEAMKNVMPEDRLDKIFTACRDLNEEKVKLYKEVDKANDKEAGKIKQVEGDDYNPAQEDESLNNSVIKINETKAKETPNNTIKQTFLQRLFSCISCSKK